MLKLHFLGLCLYDNRMLQHGLIDLLESLRLAGLDDWGPFQPSPESPSSGMPTTVLQDVPLSPDSPPIPMPLSATDRQATLDIIAGEVTHCRRCAELAATRTQTVFGVGNPAAKLVFLGEAPGAEEDKQGIPFVGRAGQLLTDILEKGMRITRDDVYICNILRCRPPGNRNPSPDEAAKCREYLDRTLDVVKPQYICCLGAVAAQNLLQTETTIGRLRGSVHDYQGIKVVCTYHPAYLLRNPGAKKETWKDIQILMKLMGLTRPGET